MLLEVKARDIIITDVRDAHVLRRYLNEEERNIVRPVKALWDKQRGLVTLDTVKHALQLGTVPPEWENGWNRMIREFVRDDMAPEWIKGISTAGDRIARKVNIIQRKQFDFDTTRISVMEWIDKQGGIRIADLTKAQFNSVRALLQDQIAQGVTSHYVLAQRIRPIIGLTERETAAISKSMASLIEEGVPMAKVNSQLGKYALFLHKNRASRIARTEISNAYNFGQLNSIRQASDAGWLPGMPEKEWMAGGANPCEICEENEDAGFIALDAAFPSGHEHPTAHPSCECSVGYKVRR